MKMCRFKAERMFIMSTIISISNQKGGVSKTVTSFNLGACLAINHEKKVLLADIDPQANLSEYLGYEPDGKPTMTQLIMTACMGNAVSAEIVKTAVRYSERSKTDYIPADINLASTESLMSTAISRETILKRILSDEVTENYDFVIIDCLPSLGSLLINALTAANKVLIPVQTQKFSMDGLQALEALIEQIKSAVNSKISYLGILPTMVDRTKVSQNALQTLSEKYDSKILNTYISKSVEAAKSTETGIPLCLTGSKLGIEYKKLTTEVLKKC